MPAIHYQNFDLLFDLIESRQERYRVRVFNSSAGEASNEFDLPFSDLDLQNFLQNLGRARQEVSKVHSLEMAAVKDFGNKLFDAVFAGRVQTTLELSLQEARRQGEKLRIRLHFTDAPSLIELPWEYLHDSSQNRFLSLSRTTLIVRYLDLSQPITPLTIEPPLKILVMIASPDDKEKLDVDAEWGRIQEALNDLRQRKLVTVKRLEKATLSELRHQLRQDQYHIFHFVGHGDFDEQTESGVLLVEAEDGSSYKVSRNALGTLLHDQSLRLVILNACKGARTARTDPFAGVAQYLVQQGIPAVIAMQFAVTDKTAITFSHEFYKALAANDPVDAALVEARKTISMQENGNLEWGIPALYMRSPDGYIFQIPAKQNSQNLSFQKKNEESNRQVYVTSNSWLRNSLLVILRQVSRLRNSLNSKKSFTQYFALLFVIIVLGIYYIGSTIESSWKRFMPSSLSYSQSEGIATPELTIIPTPSQPLKENALNIWVADLQNIYNPTGSVSHNDKIMSRRDIPEDVTCNIYAYLSSWWFQKDEEWQLICSDNNSTTRVTIQVNGIAARGLTGGDYRTHENPLTIYGTGRWPARSYEAAIVSSQLLKENALGIWATELQKIYNPTGVISDNTNVISKGNIPEDVACDVFSDSNGWWPKKYESWQLLCSNNDFKTTILILVNGTAARGLTGGSFYSHDNPFTVYGTGRWPNASYEPSIPTVTTPMPTSALTTTSTFTGTPIVTQGLVPTITLTQTP